MKKTLFFIALSSCWLSFIAQTFNGQIRDAKTNKTIAFANIGIINKPVGTMTDESGNFSLVLEDKYNDDVLNISMIGYKPVSIKVSEFKSKYAGVSANIIMTENSYALAEVVVRPVKYKTKTVGNTNTGQPCINFIGDTTNSNETAEVGTLIKIKHPAFIDNIGFCVCSNDFDSITIRVNIYSRSSNENILRKPIYAVVKKGDTKINIDTKKYNIKVDDDFIIAFEALNILQHKEEKGKKESKKFSFSGGFFGADMLLRESIYNEWQKVRTVVVGFNATITYEAKR